jgi:hypothetical protein
MVWVSWKHGRSELSAQCLVLSSRRVGAGRAVLEDRVHTSRRWYSRPNQPRFSRGTLLSCSRVKGVSWQIKSSRRILQNVASNARFLNMPKYKYTVKASAVVEHSSLGFCSISSAVSGDHDLIASFLRIVM